MTNHMAAKELRERIDLIDVNYRDNVPGYREVLELAVSALEKQEPKEALNETGLKNFADEIYAYHGNCPACGMEGLVSTRTNYCPNCGQAIDWGGKA